MKVSLLILLLVIMTHPVWPQENKIPESVKDIAEELAASDDDPEAGSLYLDRLCELSENPVNLNSGDEDDLSRLFFLSGFQVKALADYTRTTGKLVSFNELAYIPGFDQTTSEMIIPFATISETDVQTKDTARFNHSFITNLAYKTGSKDSSWLGSAPKLLSRYKFNAGCISGGITIEKDQGEKLFCPGTVLPDFLTANISYKGTGFVRKIIAGDYSLRFGHGISINTGTINGLSLTSQAMLMPSNEVRPYSSTDENNFFRGIASVLSYRNLEISLFGSRNNIDATTVSPGENSPDFVQSFYRPGIHNTADLLKKRDAVTESSEGVNLSINLKNVRLGALWSANSFSLPVMKDTIRAEKAFSFSGRSTSAGSVFYSAAIRRILLSGELSANDFRRYAAIQELSFRPSDRLIINLLIWKYSQGYIALHGKGPGSSSGTYQEQSLLGNFTFEAAKHLFVSGGFCIQHFPWLKYRCSSPSACVKRELRIKYIPTDRFAVDLLYSYRFTVVDGKEDQGIPDLTGTTSRSLKVVARYSVYDNLMLTTRIDYRHISPEDSRGTLLLEDLNFRFRNIPLSLWLRFCVFSSDDYESRIYTYENDLLYTFSIPAMYGKGSRFYVMASWKFSRKAEMRLKYAIRSDFADAGGHNDIDEIKVQFKIAI